MNNKGEKNLLIFTLKLVILILIIFLQIISIKYIYLSTKTLSIYAKNIFEILKVLLVLNIIYKDQQISYKLSWIILILLSPILGILLYVFFGINNMPKKIKNKINNIYIRTDKYLNDDKFIIEKLKNEEFINYNQIKFVKNITSFPICSNTNLKYMETGEKYFDNLLKDINNAKNYIFIEYFIISKSEMWNKLYKVIEKKSKEGVKIYILYDFLGSVSRLPKHLKRISKKNNNIKIKSVNPVTPIISSYLNYRDHRKIVVIDGDIAYTGGINIGDEYINVINKFGYWKDTGVRLEGEAVWSFVIIFLRMWEISSKEEINYIDFKSKKLFNFKNGYVIPYCDGPNNLEKPAKNIYISMINNAKKYIYITTPYLIIDDEIMLALCNSVKSGVDVRILIPGIPDKKLVYLTTKSFCTKLLKNGVKVYKYSKGFLHSKTIITDDENAVVGSINFDYRSLYLNYENAIYTYKTNLNKEMKNDFNKMLKESQEIFYKDISDKNIILRILESILRIFSPLL